MELRHKTILVADDDVAIVESISSILNYAGYEVMHVYDGTSVMESVKAQPDLVILDIAMAGHNGLTVCKQLKRQGSTQNIPVIIISAGHNVRQSAFDAGANDFLAKPFDMHVLQERISALLV
ncbi:response regulator transcription factor [Mucilaginibacter polytrichastri]|uniref:Response regulator mprA n=1 Tax=Mucilaginibacter polytrichastri TaxID=1302689 RepID=A0A1Q5ZUA7_9SPHI|nr:response regulator transcription factor [Mucilaginibacter polytrichastri]OKS85350.1 Response regulator mprA [Mucilaginibacter polytrichastri]SFS40313.1 Response regulator receiver domain-containing protein [Mucilaginibacter polytrichastri]